MSKKTEWIGLIYNGNGVYSSSKIINTLNIPECAKLVIRDNKGSKDFSKPRLECCFVNSGTTDEIRAFKLDNVINIEVLKKEIEELKEKVSNMYTREEVQYAIDRAAEDGMRGYGPGDNIVSDYLD